MPKRGKAHFLVACGTSIATSTMVAEILREDLVRQKSTISSSIFARLPN